MGDRITKLSATFIEPFRLPARGDGGMTKNDLLTQFQADVIDSPVVAPEVAETRGSTGRSISSSRNLRPAAWRKEPQ